MALYHKVNGRLVKVNGAMDDAIKSARDDMRKGATVDDAVKSAIANYGLTDFESKELKRHLLGRS